MSPWLLACIDNVFLLTANAKDFQMLQIREQGNVLESKISSLKLMHKNKVIMMPVLPIKVL